MDFEWDPRKNGANQRKHGVAFEEASTIFADPLAWTVVDPDHSESEERFLTTGYSSDQRLIIVAHADREPRIRIISARAATASRASNL